MKWGLVAAAAATAALAAAPAAAQGPATLSLGFTDAGISFDPDPTARAGWLDRLAGVNASRLRIEADWRRIAPSAPAAGEDVADPAWPGYSWAGLDAAVTEAQARGLAPIVVLHHAPDWAQEQGRPSSAAPGSWRPRPAALAAFARAATIRYRDVGYWQVWNEPNLGVYLSPQWNGRTPASPGHYRRMLNAVYDAVKEVDAADVVVTAGTAPFGDPGTGGARIRPARFVRALLAAPVRFDVLAHHVYSVGGPNRRALNADDVTVPDLAKLVRPLRRAEAAGRARPRKRHRVWVTEISWDSRPPDPDGVPAATHARWLAESLYVLWRGGVDTVAWYLGRDRPRFRPSGRPTSRASSCATAP